MTRRKRMTRYDAADLACRYRIIMGADFHQLRATEVTRVLEAAKEWGYRAPKNANGSRARYFYAYLNRAHRKDE